MSATATNTTPRSMALVIWHDGELQTVKRMTESQFDKWLSDHFDHSANGFYDDFCFSTMAADMGRPDASVDDPADVCEVLTHYNLKRNNPSYFYFTEIEETA